MNNLKNVKPSREIMDWVVKSLQAKRNAFSIAAISLLGSAMLVGCGGGGGDNASSLPSKQNGNVVPSVSAGTWVVMGSSTAAGVGTTKGKKWSDLLQVDLSSRGVKFENIARGGTFTYHGLSKSTAPVPNRPAPDTSINIDKALSFTPVVLMLSYPTNDTAEGFSVDETVNNIASMRSAAFAAGAQVLVLSTQPRNLPSSQLAQLQQVDTRLAASVGECFVKVHQLLSGPDDHLAPAYDSGDGIHPNDAGHRVIADAVLKTVNSGRCFRLPAP